MNCDEFVTGSSGGEIAAASDGFETPELERSPALADKQQQEKIEATARMESQRGNFTAGFLFEPATTNATQSSSRRAGIVIYPRN
jgi:hypothetical protein